MKSTSLALLIVVSAVVLAACSSSQPATTTPAAGGAGTAAEEKKGDTTKTGVISQTAGKFYLQEAGKTPVEIDSYAIELSAYVGQTVTVTGQYSGDTLFVGKVE